MDKNKAKQYLDYLDDKYTEWYTHPKQRSKIASEVYDATTRWDDEIYNYLSPGNATGLFKQSFFETDIKRAFELLGEIVNEGKPKSENKLYKIFPLLQNYQAKPNDIIRKELKDYLIEKIHNGELSKGKITFKDDEDYRYFSKLTSSIGVNADGLLEEIVMWSFTQE